MLQEGNRPNRAQGFQILFTTQSAVTIKGEEENFVNVHEKVFLHIHTKLQTQLNDNKWDEKD